MGRRLPKSYCILEGIFAHRPTGLNYTYMGKANDKDIAKNPKYCVHSCLSDPCYFLQLPVDEPLVDPLPPPNDLLEGHLLPPLLTQLGWVAAPPLFDPD